MLQYIWFFRLKFQISEFHNMQNNRIRIYDLAKELKQNSHRLIKELQAVGINVSVPSNQIDTEFADKLRQKYFVNKEKIIQTIKVIKKSSLQNDESKLINSKNKNFKSFVTVTSKSIEQIEKYEYKEHPIQLLEEEIKVLEKRIRSIKKSLPLSLFKHLITKMETELQEKKLTLPKVINEKKTNSKYENCIHCNTLILEKNLYDHTEINCPKKPTQITNNLHNLKTEGIPFTNKNSIENYIKVERLSWELLPQGEWLFTELQNHFKRLSSTNKWRNKPFDENRLQKIEKFLKPNKCYIGNDEFEGYVVYCFNWTNSLILECPIYGNAIYIIKKGEFSWEEIAKATKWEARTKYSNQVKVINHRDTWLERLEQSLRYDF